MGDRVKLTVHPDLAFHIRVFSRLIYFVTEEEDRFLVQLHDAMRDRAKHVKVYNAALGLVPLAALINDWKTKAHKESRDTIGIHDALIAIYKEEVPNEREFYVITDPERWLQDQHVQRRILNILHQVHNDVNTVKVIICVSSRRYVPEKLSRYMEVIQDTGLTDDEILSIIGSTCASFQEAGVPIEATEVSDQTTKLLRGLTSFEVQSALIQTFKKTRSLSNSRLLSSYRFKQLKKTDLIQYIDTSKCTFDSLGGAGRFKAWVQKTKAAWTEDGKKFGLEPPRGILAVGVWGTGKSLSIKALGNEWGLPTIQLEMGRLRSSAVGESEANVYRAIRIIETVAPCVVWVDEAEKSLAGGHSSSFTDAGTTSRTIGILSTWLQEMQVPVCLALTANSLRTLPVEFINRMNERWFFDLPSQEDRIDILKIHLLKRGRDPKRFNLALLAEKAEAMVGREIEQCILAAMTEAYSRKEDLSEEILVEELARKPRIVRTMVDEIKETLDWVGFDAEVDDGVRARFASNPSMQDRKLRVLG